MRVIIVEVPVSSICEKEKDCIDVLTEQFAQIANIKTDNSDDFLYLDKMRCPLKRAEKKYRFQILLKIKRNNLNALLQRIYSVCAIERKTFRYL